MPDVIFEEIECKSAVNRVSATNMPFRWSLNPYRGCQHACTYCFARGTHEVLGYDAAAEAPGGDAAARRSRHSLRRPAGAGAARVNRRSAEHARRRRGCGGAWGIVRA